MTLKNAYPLRGIRRVKAHPWPIPTKASGKMPGFFLPQKQRKWQRLQRSYGTVTEANHSSSLQAGISPGNSVGPDLWCPLRVTRHSDCTLVPTNTSRTWLVWWRLSHIWFILLQTLIMCILGTWKPIACPCPTATATRTLGHHKYSGYHMTQKLLSMHPGSTHRSGSFKIAWATLQV